MTPLERDRLARQYAAALLEDPQGDLLADVAESLEPLPREEPAVGQLWRAAPVEAGRAQALLLLTHTSEIIRGLLATEEAWLATHDDILVPAERSPTGSELMVATWSDTPVPRRCLMGLLGTLDPEIMEPILMLLQSTLTGGFKLRAQTALRGPGLGATQWTIQRVAGTSAAATFVTGTRVTDPLDGRLEARDALCTATRWIARAAVVEAWEHGGAPEPASWQSRLFERLREAVAALSDAVVGSPAATTARSEARVNRPGLTVLGGGASVDAEVRMTAGWPGLAPGTLRAIGSTLEEGAHDPLRFTIPVGGAEVEVWLEALANDLSVLVIAHEAGVPKKGLAVELRVLAAGRSKRIRRRTKTNGIASIPRAALAPDAAVELALGEGEAKRVIQAR